MRPPGLAGALIAITAGAVLTFAVSFTISGISIHTVGVIITSTGMVALAIRLARSLSTLRKQDESRRALNSEPAQRRVDESHSAATYRTRRTPQR